MNENQFRDFFEKIRSPLYDARDREKRLNQQTAHRFNSLQYLRTDEFGLSRIIADLLDPQANHGQGLLFLQILLNELIQTNTWADTRLQDARVATESVITNQRRIDILVRIPSSDSDLDYCVAIENKPYSDDQLNQISDYLNWLSGEFCDRFFLIYLSPSGEGPAEQSLPRNDLDKWKGRFLIMSYRDMLDSTSYRDDDESTYTDYQAPISLSCWLQECRNACQVERLRWFLRELELFCEQTFGVRNMSSDTEMRAVRDFLTNNPENLEIAKVVYESWEKTRDEVFASFIKQIRDAVEIQKYAALPDWADDLVIEHEYNYKPVHRSRLFVYLKSWNQAAEAMPASAGCNSVALEAYTREGGINGWYCGVCAIKSKLKMTPEEEHIYDLLKEKLRSAFSSGKASPWYPYYFELDQQKANWENLMHDLSQETRAKTGDITDYFVNTLLSAAKIAIPIIDEVEKGQSSA